MNDDRLISLNAAIDLVCKEGTRLERNGTVAMAEIKQWCVDLLEALPSAQRLLEDGTLIVKVPNLSAVHRVIVDEENSQYCKTFYQDGDEVDT